MSSTLSGCCNGAPRARLFFAEGTRKSLEAAPAVSGLARALPAVDQQALEHLTRYPEIVDVATASERVEKLWEACALPDYRRITPAQHADLISTIYADLVRHGTVNEDFMAEQVGAPIIRTAKSTHFRRELRRSGPGPMYPTGPGGLPIRHTGKKRRGKSKIDCPTRYMKG